MDGNLKFRPMTLPDRYIDHGTQVRAACWACAQQLSLHAAALVADFFCTTRLLLISILAGRAAGRSGRGCLTHCGDSVGSAGQEEIPCSLDSNEVESKLTRCASSPG